MTVTAETSRPLIAVYTAESMWQDSFLEEVRERVFEWARKQGVDINGLYRIEVWGAEKPTAKVFQFAENSDGSRYCAMVHDHITDLRRCEIAVREPFEVDAEGLLA